MRHLTLLHLSCADRHNRGRGPCQVARPGCVFWSDLMTLIGQQSSYWGKMKTYWTLQGGLPSWSSPGQMRRRTVPGIRIYHGGKEVYLCISNMKTPSLNHFCFDIVPSVTPFPFKRLLSWSCVPFYRKIHAAVLFISCLCRNIMRCDCLCCPHCSFGSPRASFVLDH